MAGERITIVLPADLAAKLRKIQAKEITRTNATVSFSATIASTLRKCL